VGIAFLMGITAAAYSSADSALTAMTTSFSVDFLKIDRHQEIRKRNIKKKVHLLFSILLILVIIGFRIISNESVVVAVFTVAGYTYGPILGLFVFRHVFQKKRKRSMGANYCNNVTHLCVILFQPIQKYFFMDTNSDLKF
jgi:Na+/proline symporter